MLLFVWVNTNSFVALEQGPQLNVYILLRFTQGLAHDRQCSEYLSNYLRFVLF